MSTQEIRVPDLGDFDNVEVIEILVQAGDAVQAEDSILSLESEKATMEVPSPLTGVINELKINLGDSVSSGDLVALITPSEAAKGIPSDVIADPAPKDEPASKVAEAPASPPARPTPRPPSAPSQVQPVAGPGDSGSSAYASPSVRKFARTLGIDVAQIAGTGRKGRIIREDVEGFVKSRMSNTGGSGGLSVAAMPSVDFSKFGPVSDKPLSRIQKISGSYLHRNWVSIPHVTQNDEADITEMEAFRKACKVEGEKRGSKLTPLAFLVKAVVASLKAFPDFNASLDAGGESLVLKQFFHIGIAVDTPNGLVVPVLRDCDKKGLWELADEMAEVGARARDGKLGPAEMQGGCFSISSLGGIGGTSFTPIINAPEVAILGVSRSSTKPVWQNGAFEPRLMLPLSLSYDHRVIDGASAARFVVHLSSVLSDLRRLLL